MIDGNFETVSFYHSRDRYAQFGEHGHVITACYHGSDDLEYLTYNLACGDSEAFEAKHKINEMIDDGFAFIGTDKNPLEAMRKCIENIKVAKK